MRSRSPSLPKLLHCETVATKTLARRLHRWNKPVLVYGDDNLRKDHPVVAILAREKRCASLGIYKAGCAVGAS